MTITVQLPDGNIAEFPDGTPMEVMKSALAKYRTAPQAPSAAQNGWLGPSDDQLAQNRAQMDQRIDAASINPLAANIVGDNDPTTQNTGEKIGALLNKAGESLTFGLVGDETSAAAESLLPGVDYDARRDHYRQQEALVEKTNPGLSMAADIGGAVVGALGPIGAIGTLGRGAGMGARMLASGAAGAGMGAVSGFTEGEGGVAPRANDALFGGGIGALAGVAAPLIGGAVQKIADGSARNAVIRALAKNAPSTDDLRTAGRAAYKAVDDAGVSIKPEAFSSARQAIAAAMRGRGLDELPGPGSLTPMSARANQIMGGMDDAMRAEPTASLPFSSLDQLRRHAGTAAGNMANKTDSSVGTEMVSRLDDFVGRLGPDDVDAGDVATLQTALPKARELWARMSRSQTVDDAIDASENYLGGSASGIRNQFKRIVSSPKLSRGFSEPEIAMMRRVINGSGLERLLTLAGGGMGQLTQFGAGVGLGGPVGGLIGAATAVGTRKASEAVARKNAEMVRAVIAAGGLPKAPQASDAYRKISEAMTRRLGTSN